MASKRNLRRLISRSDEYLSQSKERVEIDLDNNLTSGKKHLDVTVCCTISVRWKISLLRLNTLKLHVGCERCIKSYGVNVSGQWLKESKSRKRCTKCSSIFDVEIRPMLCHDNSTTLGSLKLNKAICKDILDGTTLIATCDKCGAESVMPPIRRKVRVEKKCYSCHTKMALHRQFECRGHQGKSKESKKTKSRPARKALSTIFFALANRSLCKGLVNIMKRVTGGIVFLAAVGHILAQYAMLNLGIVNKLMF